MQNPRWKGFESLAATIYAELHPTAVVELDTHIQGSISGSSRQIDVAVTWRDGEDSYLMIVDCKDHNRPADITKVDAFASVVRDVGAAHGVLVCNAGFTNKTHTYARNLGIDLVNVHDAQSRDWSRDLTIPILWTTVVPLVQPRFMARFEAGDQFRFETLEVRHKGTGAVVRLFDAFVDQYNGGRLEYGRGQHVKLEMAAYDGLFVTDASGAKVLRPATIGLEYDVQLEEAWLGRFAPAECRGLIDYLDGGAFTASHLPLTSIPTERDESWERVDDPDKIAIATRGTLVETVGFQILGESLRLDNVAFHRLGD